MTGISAALDGSQDDMIAQYEPEISIDEEYPSSESDEDNLPETGSSSKDENEPPNTSLVKPTKFCGKQTSFWSQKATATASTTLMTSMMTRNPLDANSKINAH